MYIEEFGLKDTPKFLVGISMGGLISAIMANNSTYNGICLLNPSFKLGPE